MTRLNGNDLKNLDNFLADYSKGISDQKLREEIDKIREKIADMLEDFKI